MDTKSAEILDLLEAVRLVLSEDWTTQYARQERTLNYSESNLQKQLQARYPEIGTKQFFKTIYGYAKHNAEISGDEKVREISLRKAEILFRFLFMDMSTDYGWPSVIKTVKEFKDGKYLPLIKEYLEETSFSKIEKLIAVTDLEKAGATPGQDTYIQLLQLVLKAKNEHDTNKQYMAKVKDEQMEKDKLQSLYQSKIKEVKDEMSKLQGILETKSGDQSDIISRLDKLKLLLDSLI
jgi:hypothetical protein